MIIIFIAIYAILTLITLRNPLIGAGTLWIVMWTYPNNLLYGTLPLNIRFDDLYIVITFLSCMAHSHAKLTNSPTLLLSLLWLLVIVIGNINGYLYTGGRSLPEITKLVLKATYVPMIAAILLMQVISFKNFAFILKCMLVAGATAAILGICTVLFPEIFQIFLFPDEDIHGTVLNKLELSELIERRARGAVGIVATSLICPITCLLSTVILSIKNNKIFSSQILILITIISFIGLLYTQSRGPLIGLCLAIVVFLIMLKGGKGLPALALFLGAVSIFLIIDSPLRDIVLNRFTGGSGEEFGQGVDLRAHIWNTFINNLEPINLVNGLGMVPVKNVYFFTVHNTYLGAIIYGGIWGILIMIMVIARLLRVSGMLAKSHYPYIRQWSVFLPLLLIFLLVTGFSMENFQQTNCMQIFFGILAISEKMPALNDYPNYV